MKATLKMSSKGISLIELMFGVAVLLTVILAIALSFLNSMFLCESSRNLVTAANDAQHVLEQVKALDYDTQIAANFSSSYTLPTLTNLKNEVLAFDPAPVITSSVSKVTVKVSWTERQNNRSFSLATNFTSNK